MTMQRRHFELIAETLKTALHNADYPEAHARESWRGVENAVYAFCKSLRTTNPNFNEARFLRACGVEG